jgi:hypothetical protein
MTVGERIIPEIAASYETGRPPRLLLTAGGLLMNCNHIEICDECAEWIAGRRAWSSSASRRETLKTIHERLKARAGELWASDDIAEAEALKEFARALEPELRQASADLDEHIKKHAPAAAR